MVAEGMFDNIKKNLHEVLKMKAELKNKCQCCQEDLQKRLDYLCAFCRLMKNMEGGKLAVARGLATRCSKCKTVLCEDDRQLSEKLKIEICWDCMIKEQKAKKEKEKGKEKPKEV